MQKGPNHCLNPRRAFLYSPQLGISRAEVMAVPLSLNWRWTISEFAWPLLIAFSCQFSNHFTTYSSFKVNVSILIRDLFILAQSLGFQRKGLYYSRQRFLKNRSCATIWTGKNPPSPCLLRWTAGPVGSFNHCAGIVLLNQARDASCFCFVLFCFLLQYHQEKNKIWAFKIVSAIMDGYVPAQKKAMQTLGTDDTEEFHSKCNTTSRASSFVILGFECQDSTSTYPMDMNMVYKF